MWPQEIFRMLIFAMALCFPVTVIQETKVHQEYCLWKNNVNSKNTQNAKIPTNEYMHATYVLP